VASNVYHYSGSLVTIELTNTEPHVFVIAYATDAEELSSHRLRWIAGHVLTTQMVDGLELPIPAVNILLRLPRTASVCHLNRDTTDLRRDNLKRGKAIPSNDYRQQGEVTYLCLPNGQTAYIDSDDIARVCQQQWSARITHGEVHVVGRKRKGRLDRFLLGMKPHDQRRLTHLNNDPLDCRKSNLYVVSKHD
jgi:hypothetical protein